MSKKRNFLARWWLNFINSRFYIKFWRFWRVYFKMNEQELRGFIIASVILFLAVLANTNLIGKILYRPGPVDTSFTAQLNDFLKELKPKPKASFKNKLDQYIKARYDTLKLFRFDPNTASEADLKRLGLTYKQVANVINFRRSGGKFRTKADFGKLYTIRKLQFDYLKPYINLPESLPKKQMYRDTAQHHKAKRKVQLFAFNPNTVSEDSLILLGFSPRQAKSIVKARNKGWKFRVKADFKKLYAVNDSTYKILSPYILLPDSLVHKKKTYRKIELNTARAEDLVKLGFTPAQAQDIITYRQKLGGFYSTYQLYEVHSLTKDLIKHTYWKMSIDTTLIHKINLKTADYQTLASHPYIYKKLAKWIVRHQKRKKFTSLAYLKKSPYCNYYKCKYLSHYFYVK